MKKTILYIALSTISISLFLSSCESKAKKVEEATVNVEERNAQLKNRLYGYENERTDWINFKNEFNRDMDEMGEAFKNLGKKKP